MQLLYDTFSAFGMIVSTPKVMRDPDTGLSKGFGFVSYETFEASDAAIEAMHNQFLMNRYSSTREDAPPSSTSGRPFSKPMLPMQAHHCWLRLQKGLQGRAPRHAGRAAAGRAAAQECGGSKPAQHHVCHRCAFFCPGQAEPAV